jgi:RimJ/RimL family protein N-acetyltransferase
MLRPSDIHIHSDRLSLRPFSATDADDTFPCITLSLTRFMSWDPPRTREDFDRVWQSWQPAMEKGSDYVFAIRQREDSNFLGIAGLHDITSECAELGIWIREDRHHQGFGREAVTLVARWASRILRIPSFIYPVAEANTASRRIAESLRGVIVETRLTPKYSSVIYRIPAQTNNS